MEEKNIKIGFEVLAEISVNDIEGDNYMQKLDKFKKYIENQLQETVAKWSEEISTTINSTEEAIVNAK